MWNRTLSNEIDWREDGVWQFHFKAVPHAIRFTRVGLEIVHQYVRILQNPHVPGSATFYCISNRISPVELYVCETLRDKGYLRTNPRQIFGPKRDENGRREDFAMRKFVVYNVLLI